MMPAAMRWSSAAGREALAALLVFLIAVAGLAILREGSAPDYRLSAEEAVAAARDDTRTRRFLERQGGFTRAESIPLYRELRRVTFFDGPRVVLDVAVDESGRVPYRQEHREGVAESGSAVANSPWLLALFTGLFLLATAVVPLRRLRNLDALALASFTSTVVLINERLVVASTAVAAVPLCYLIVRCLQVAGGHGRSGPATPAYAWLTRGWEPRQAARVLGLVVGGLALAVLMVTLTSAGESDVATASLSGATELLDGRLPYGNIVEGVVHGDTYPFLTYVSYVPGALLTPVEDAFSDRSGALVVAAAATAAAGAAFHRLAGPRGVLAWLAFPPVVLTASGGSNDMVLAALLAWALALWASVGRSSLLLAAAAWVKVVPLVLVPVWLARLRRDSILRAVVPGVALSALLCGWLILLGGVDALGKMVESLSFQLQRGSFHSPWRPFGLEGLQLVVQAGLLAAVAALALRARRDTALRRDPTRLAAALGGLLLWLQLAANYWTWAYLPWVFPFVAVALLAGATEGAAGAGSPGSRWEPNRAARASGANQAT